MQSLPNVILVVEGLANRERPCRGDYLGSPFNTVADTLQQLGGGDIANLPTYPHVIATSDESRIYELRNNLLELYHERDRTLQKQHNNENYGLRHAL